MRIRFGAIVLLLSILSLVAPANADVFVFTDEASYNAMLTSLSYRRVQEGFEDDNAWGSVRSSITGGWHTAPSITNLGITWEANTSNSQVTTGSGPARTGQWGFFTYPHGDPPLIGDGFKGTSATPIYGVGGWIETNTPPAGISLWLDIGLPGEMEVDFDGNDVLSTTPKFFGVINTAGFTRFDYLETEFDFDERKFIFADDFTFAKPATDVAPSSFSIFRGFLNSGGLSDLLASDDQKLVVRAGITLSSSESPLQVIVTGTSPVETPSVLEFKLEASVSTPGLMQTLWLYNYDIGQYEEVDFWSGTPSDSVVEVVVSTDAGRFVQAGTREMKAKVSYKQVGIVLHWPWSARFDQTAWTIVP